MRTLGISFSLLVLLFTFGCKDGSTAPQEKINTSPAKEFVEEVDNDAYIENHPSLPQVDIDCIKDGTPRVGIQVATLTYILGKPDKAANDDASVINETAVLTYSKLGKAYAVEDQGGTIVVVSIRDLMPQE